MNRGGRGSGGAGKSAVAGVRAIANVLGISRQEVGQFTTQQVRNEPLPLYPPLNKDPLPLEETKELVFMTDTKQEFLQRFRDSPFYHKRASKRDVKRYTDKYRLMDKEPFEPHWERLPAELNWRTAKGGRRKETAGVKRARLDENALLERLDQREQKIKDEVDDEETGGKEGHGEEEDEDDATGGKPRPPVNEDEEEVEYSDEDYLVEGANDYVETYFDGGDDYEGDGDGLEEDGAY